MDDDRIETYWRSCVDTLPVDSPVRDDVPLVCERFRVIYK